MYFVPEGQHDRSLARSAWESVHRENRPVGYGMIGRSYPRHPKGIFKFRQPNYRIGAHAGANQNVSTGRLFWVALFPGTSCQATIAPSGTKPFAHWRASH
jgi:hypothetical protein